MAERSDEGTNWKIASGHWDDIGSPLRPCSEDVGAYEEAVGRYTAGGRADLSAVLLGVTPELAASRWPGGTRLVAVDFSQAMIGALWPAPGITAKAAAICADWRRMPLRPDTADVVVGDGCYAALEFPEHGAALTREIARVMRPDGVFAIRVFLRPDSAETVDGLRAEVAAGRVGSVHALKWRIAAAVQRTTEEGVRVGDIWEAWRAIESAAGPMMGRPGWGAGAVATLARYRGNATRYFFPTATEFRALVRPYFVELGCAHGTYELAERCPVFSLRPR